MFFFFLLTHVVLVRLCSYTPPASHCQFICRHFYLASCFTFTIHALAGVHSYMCLCVKSWVSWVSWGEFNVVSLACPFITLHFQRSCVMVMETLYLIASHKVFFAENIWSHSVYFSTKEHGSLWKSNICYRAWNAGSRRTRSIVKYKCKAWTKAGSSLDRR